jgi:outer membrane protein TolC
MKQVLNKLFLLPFAFGVASVFAQEKLTLQQAIETGLKNNFDIRIAKINTEISANNATLGNAGMLPRADVSLAQTNGITDTKQTFNTGQEVDRTGAAAHSLTATAALNWTVFDGFTMFASYNKLKELNALGETAAKVTVENNVQQIIETYFDVVRQKALLVVTDNSRQLSELKLNIAKTKFNIGTFSKTEYLQAQVDLNADVSSYKKQLLTIANAKVMLNRLLARDAAFDFEPADSMQIDFNANYTEMVDQLTKNNSMLKMSRQQVNIYNYSIKEWQGLRFPQLNINGNYTYLKSTAQTGLVLENRSKGFNYGFTLSYTLFNGFNTSRTINNAKLDWEISKLNYELTQAQQIGELLMAYKNFESNKEIVQLETLNSGLAQENVNLTLERFRVGTINELQLKAAMQSNVQAQSNLVNSLYNTKVSETTLKKLTGILLK